MRPIVFIVAATLVFASCSKKQVKNTETPIAEIDGASAEEEFNLDEADSEMIDTASQDLNDEVESVIDSQSSQVATKETNETTKSHSDLMARETNEFSSQNTSSHSRSKIDELGPVINQPGAIREYIVKENDTLMLVAHTIYGDYTKWKALQALNGSKIRGLSKLKAGTILKYEAPEREYEQEANGEPYLILLHDTLGKISGKVYQTPRRWKEIWKNNSYIKDPNLIFAGFTLYYVKDNKVASGI